MTDQPSSRGFSDKLRHLIANMHPPDRGSYSYRELSEGIKRDTGTSISHTTLNQLAMGGRVDPKLTHVEAIARFFGVPAAYFFDDEIAARVDSELQEILAWRDEDARALVQRAMQLSPGHRTIVSDLIARLHEYEQIPPDQRRRRKPPAS